ncbi:hypothetical protein B296_00049692 [Ensete ventricosum]|uniref:Uncharacterized protein n=1 Tax=Ensete ventricosum TaxID=4639 RepID=A0A426XHM9_ENSVE|nr:hypothetical protein B296_00049692 [Ensete ventricosum]
MTVIMVKDMAAIMLGACVCNVNVVRLDHNNVVNVWITNLPNRLIGDGGYDLEVEGNSDGSNGGRGDNCNLGLDGATQLTGAKAAVADVVVVDGKGWRWLQMVATVIDGKGGGEDDVGSSESAKKCCSDTR